MSKIQRVPVDQYVPQIADLIAFAGTGKVSRTIQMATCSSISHIACVAEVHKNKLEDLRRCGILPISQEIIDGWESKLLLFESSTLIDAPCAITNRHIKGVQSHDPNTRIQNYNGRVWCYRLAPDWRYRLEELDGANKLSGHLLARLGTQYDGGGAILSGTHVLRRWWAWSSADRSTLFCSEYIATVLQHVNLFPLTNPSEVTPIGLLRTVMRGAIYERPFEVVRSGNDAQCSC